LAAPICALEYRVGINLTVFGPGWFPSGCFTAARELLVHVDRGDGERTLAEAAGAEVFRQRRSTLAMNLPDPQLMARFNDDFLFSLIKKGKIGSITDDGFETMQPFGQVLSDNEIWSVIRYIRETFVNPNKEKSTIVGRK
jgi:hypothetical protein